MIDRQDGLLPMSAIFVQLYNESIAYQIRTEMKYFFGSMRQAAIGSPPYDGSDATESLQSQGRQSAKDGRILFIDDSGGFASIAVALIWTPGYGFCTRFGK